MYSSQRNPSRAPAVPYANGLNSRSRSVPEGLAHPNGDIHWNYNRSAGANSHHHLRQQQQQQQPHPRQRVQVLEQITTSV
jgi:hypothetical protein